MRRETVVLTASLGSFPGLVDALKKIPVTVEERPLISFGPPLDWAPLDAALQQLDTYSAVAFTSPRAAGSVLERMTARGMAWTSRAPEIWAIGPATAAALRGVLGSVRVPGKRLGASSTGGTLLGAMLDSDVGSPVLFPCGDIRRDELPVGLRAHGIRVDEVVCYRSVLADESDARAAAGLGNVVVVASPSVADLLARACPRASRPELLAVGPTTAASARAAGWSPAAVAESPSARALASAITGLLGK